MAPASTFWQQLLADVDVTSAAPFTIAGSTINARGTETRHVVYNASKWLEPHGLVMLPTRKHRYLITAGSDIIPDSGHAQVVTLSCDDEVVQWAPNLLDNEEGSYELAMSSGAVQHFLETGELRSLGSGKTGMPKKTTYYYDGVIIPASGVGLDFDALLATPDLATVVPFEMKRNGKSTLHRRQIISKYVCAAKMYPGSRIRPVLVEELARGDFRFREFAFPDNDMANMQLVQSCRIRIDGIAPEMTPQALRHIGNTAPTMWIPQADNVTRIVEQCVEGTLDLRSPDRQVCYYTAAAHTIGLATFDGTRTVRTAAGKKLAAAAAADRPALVADAIERHELVVYYRQHGQPATADAIVKLGKKLRMSKATAVRRAQTIAAWSKYASNVSGWDAS